MAFTDVPVLKECAQRNTRPGIPMSILWGVHVTLVGVIDQGWTDVQVGKTERSLASRYRRLRGRFVT